MLVSDTIAEARGQQLCDFLTRTAKQRALALTAQNQRLHLLEVVDRYRAHEAVLTLGEKRSGADEPEQLIVNLARTDQIDRSDAIAQGARDGAQLGAPACASLLAH